jgi:predicted RNA-binding Zn ribbon-like protein
MEQKEKSAGSLKLLGGRLSLDFANTADWHGSDSPVEMLTSYQELVAWSVHAAILAGEEANALIEISKHQPDQASTVLEQVVRLREVIYRIFSTVANGQQPLDADLAEFNTWLSRTFAQLYIVEKENGFAWDWREAGAALDRMIWPVVKDTADLLTSKELDRVRECADGKCGWLFLDTSKNRSRKWCDMKDCGNRAKVRRHYRRKR